MTKACHYCGSQVDPTAPDVWHRVIGWERKATAASRRSGSDIALREPFEEFACHGCIKLKQDGISPTQRAML